MPNIKSAEKRMRSDAKKRERNQVALSEIKTLDSKLQKLSGKPEEAKEVAAKLVSKYDKAVVRGILPRSRADRKKSRIAAFIARIQ